MSGPEIYLPESEIEVSDSESEVEYIEPDSIPLQTEMTARQLLCPPVVAQTRPMEGCDPALPRRLRRGRDVLTEDSSVAVDTDRVSTASDAVVSRETHKNSECVPTVVPKLAAAPQAASEVVQPRPPDSGCTDLLPPVGECLESLGLDTPDAVESRMEVAGGSHPAEIDICVNPDVLLTATSVTTQVSEKCVVIDTPDTVESGMEATSGSPPAVSGISVDTDTGMEMAGGSPPADVDITVGPDVLPTAVSVMSEKWMVIDSPDRLRLTLADVLLTAISVTTVVPEKWMERFVIDLDVLCSDGVASDDDPAGESSDVGSDVCVVPDPIPTAVSVRTVVAEKWMDRFIIDLVECPSVSRTSAVARTFGPAVSEEYSPVVFAGGGRLPMHTPLLSLSQIQRECLFCLLPVVSSRPFFWGRSPLMWSVWALAHRVSEWTRRNPY